MALLRSPPFPWVAASTAAVSVAGRGAPIADAARMDALAMAMREGRVGGDFWAEPAPPRLGRTMILHARDPAALRRLSAAVPTARSGDARVLCLPDAAWARAVAGPDDLLGSIDPWSLLGPDAWLVADADDPWTALAHAAGAETADPDGARALFADLVADARYRDPFTGAAATPEHAIGILADWRRTLDANRTIAAATGIAWWKRKAIGHFLWTDRAAPLIVTDDAAVAVAAAGPGQGVATWPSRAPEGLEEAAATAGVPVAAIEDGFIRSVGLGSDLHPPASIVVDRGGIYYDPGRPSDLESILATAQFPPALLARAAALRETIVARGISKYAADPVAAGRRAPRTAGRTVLVAGQVEDDASVRTGGGGVAGNLDLLRRARAAEPDAHILFKPHPDVDAGHRVGRVSDAELRIYADEVVRGEPMAGLLARVDAVHVLTSQTGFEALLRGVETIVHGRPFYSGWGLTRDLAGASSRRGRALPLDALVAATLILYPRYLDPETGLPCPPEVLLERFASGKKPRRSPLIVARQWQGRIARLLGTTTD